MVGLEQRIACNFQGAPWTAPLCSSSSPPSSSLPFLPHLTSNLPGFSISSPLSFFFHVLFMEMYKLYILLTFGTCLVQRYREVSKMRLNPIELKWSFQLLIMLLFIGIIRCFFPLIHPINCNHKITINVTRFDLDEIELIHLIRLINNNARLL